MSELRSEATAASARRRPPRLRQSSSLVTSALGAQRNGRGREGDWADRQPVRPERKARWSRRIPVWCAGLRVNKSVPYAGNAL